jgi:ribulose-phosphate 3-epimerase
MPRSTSSKKSSAGKAFAWPPRTPILSPSILSADFTRLGEAVRKIERAPGCPWLHLDVMDGHFVPNMTIGFVPVRGLRRVTDKLFFDTHIMVERPERFIKGFADAGANLLTFHEEAARDGIERVIRKIRSAGMRVGISIKPRTSLKRIMPYLEKVDLVLVMTVEPGFGGQTLIPSCLNKVRELDLLRKKNGHEYLIEVDGGINEKTISLVASAGADVFVAGHAVFGGGKVLENVRSLLEKIRG